MPQYLLSVHGNDEQYAAMSEEDMQRSYKAVDKLNAELQENGQWVFGGGLESVTTATVVHSEGGKVTTTDGPYVETKEHLGGFWIVELADLDAALSLAARASEACMGAVEVRPFQAEPEA